jgi:hypothetical protein
MFQPTSSYFQTSVSGTCKNRFFLGVISSDSSAVPVNTWYHVAYRLSGTIGTIYVNGNQTDTQSGMTPPTGQVFSSATFGISTYGNLTGDEIMLFNRALSLAEIQTIYSSFGTFFV